VAGPWPIFTAFPSLFESSHGLLEKFVPRAS